MGYRKFKNLFLLFFAGILMISCGQRGGEEQLYSGTALGTTYHIKYYSSGKEFGFAKGLDSIFRNINHSMSTYQKDTDISRINSGDSTVQVDENFRKVFLYSDTVYKQSHGYFDPTVGNLVNAYGLGPDHILAEVNDREIDSMMQYVGFNKVSITPDNHIKKKETQIFIDFNAIAKGYTIDVIAHYLDAHKVDNYLIEVGGELVAKGKNIKNNKPWVVAIDDPLQTEDERTFKATLKLTNRAMATSGNYRKFRIDSVTGQRYVHTVNPITGRSRKSNLLSASVLAKNCALADAYATSFMALGLEKSKEMLNRLDNVDAYLIYDEGNDKVSVYSTSGFKKILLSEN